ncbi:hypothetical protein [Microbacterium jejuense]|uniref:hypothetical protein n=1 Tax=Microbacterium jejuense TaxID=1263637 RepID=UPI0031EAB17E
MNEFTASNGVTVEWAGSDTSSTRWLSIGGNYMWTDEDPDVSALREFFRAEEDELLGRWRSSEHPGFVAHVHEGGLYVWVSKEVGGASTGAFYRDAVDTNNRRSEFARVARAYFDDHPVSKPWHDAKEGDIWVLDLIASGEAPWQVVGQRFEHVQTGTARPLNDKSFREGRRIWTEETA